MTLLLLGASLGLLGIVAGIYVTGLIHDHRVCDLSAGQYTAMHQMRDKTFRRVMPVVGLATVALVIASAIFTVSSGAPWALAAIAAALLLVDVAFTITRQMPLNSRVQSWTEATIPADWAHIRDQWAAQHRVRVILAMIAYWSFLAAVLLTAIR